MIYALFQSYWNICLKEEKHLEPYRGAFQWENQIPLSKTKATRQALSAANLPAKDCAGHSFRIGAAATAETVGLEDSTIKMLGRWKSSSYQLYIRTSPQQLAAVLPALSRCVI